MLRGHDRLDDGGEIVDVGERLYAEDNVVECAVLARGGLFWGFNDCRRVQTGSASRYMAEGQGREAHEEC